MKCKFKIGDKVSTCLMHSFKGDPRCTYLKCNHINCDHCSEIHTITEICALIDYQGGFRICTDKLLDGASIAWFHPVQPRQLERRIHRSHLLEP